MILLGVNVFFVSDPLILWVVVGTTTYLFYLSVDRA